MFAQLLNAIDVYIVKALARLRMQALVTNGLTDEAKAAIDEVIAESEQ